MNIIRKIIQANNEKISSMMIDPEKNETLPEYVNYIIEKLESKYTQEEIDNFIQNHFETSYKVYLNKTEGFREKILEILLNLLISDLVKDFKDFSLNISVEELYVKGYWDYCTIMISIPNFFNCIPSEDKNWYLRITNVNSFQENSNSEFNSFYNKYEKAFHAYKEIEKQISAIAEQFSNSLTFKSLDF